MESSLQQCLRAAGWHWGLSIVKTLLDIFPNETNQAALSRKQKSD
jgi:hypothetical protein